MQLQPQFTLWHYRRVAWPVGGCRALWQSGASWDVTTSFAPCIMVPDYAIVKVRTALCIASST